LFFAFGVFSSSRLKAADKLFLPFAPEKEIVIVAIDNESLEKLGRWPWPRSTHAHLIDKIASSGAAIIGLDVIFPEPSVPADDAELARAFRAAGNVILPIESEIGAGAQGMNVSSLIYSIPLLSKAALAQGISNTPPDADGIFRRLPYAVLFEKGELLSFAASLAAEYALQTGRDFPLPFFDEKKRMRINYAGRPETFPVVPAFAVLQDGGMAEILRGKIVLVGATAPDLHDEQMTPTSGGKPMSGVEIHANAVNTIISGKHLRPLSFGWQALLFFLSAFLIGISMSSRSVWFGVAGSFFLWTVYLLAAYILFDFGIELDLFLASFLDLSMLVAMLAYRVFYVNKQKRQIKSAFSRYLSREVLNDLLRNPDKLRLGGEKQELSILFSDIRGFSGFSERLAPERLVALLNEYLGAMTESILTERGVVDKYIGDAVMAFWGAPLAEPAHAHRACTAALAMSDELKKRRSDWQKRYGVELNIGIGINTGQAIAGNIGSDYRFDYTVMGDHVNLASRLEGITKQYEAEIVVSESTVRSAGAGFVFRYLDAVAAKGKKESVKIYQLVCLQDDSGRQSDVRAKKELLEGFASAIKEYQSRRWRQAEKAFAGLVKKFPEDGPSRVFLARCRFFQENPPKSDWDGVFRLEVK